MFQLSVHESIFIDFPSFRRGLVLATNINNRISHPALEIFLHQTIAKAQLHPIELNTDSRITAWDEAHRKFGSNPNTYIPSHKALLKRVQKPGATLRSISNIVDLMNAISITHVLPVGGDDLLRSGRHLQLCKAAGTELFIPLDAKGPPAELLYEHPTPGEVIYLVIDTQQVCARRWNWRNSKTTAITEQTSVVAINVDGLGEHAETNTLAARDTIAKMLESLCNANVVTSILSPTSPSFHFTI